MASSVITYLDLAFGNVLGLRRELAVKGDTQGKASRTRLTRLLTTILLSPVKPALLAGAGLAALRAGFVFFWMPPAGAALAGLPPAERRPPRPRALDLPRRWVERISSRDWSSFPDIVTVGLLERRLRVVRMTRRVVKVASEIRKREAT